VGEGGSTAGNKLTWVRGSLRNTSLDMAGPCPVEHGPRTNCTPFRSGFARWPGRLRRVAACALARLRAVRPSCGLDADACPSPVPVAVKRSTLAWPIRR